MFILQESPIDILQAKTQHGPNTGALVTFEGLVRNDPHRGSEVSSLLYIANSAECIREGQNIVNETFKLYVVNDIVCIQRIGLVKVGEAATWIGVGASHRDDAFKACRHVIEETKKRLLIWKKEYYNNGTSHWIYGKETPVL